MASKGERLVVDVAGREVAISNPSKVYFPEAGITATSKWWKEERHGVFLDYNQNAKDRTVASAYSVRPKPDARVSAPVTWDAVGAAGNGGPRRCALAAALREAGRRAAARPAVAKEGRAEAERPARAQEAADRDVASYREGHLTPVFFGSALANYAVRELLDALETLAPSLRPQPAEPRAVGPDELRVTGFVFKVQANMDPNHRDRVAFVRLCSGRFRRGMKLRQVRTGRALAVHNPIFFFAQERELIGLRFLKTHEQA